MNHTTYTFNEVDYFNSITAYELLAFLKRCNQNVPVRLGDRGDACSLRSWRGDYSHLTLTPAKIGRVLQVCTIVDMLEGLKEGSEWEGYKGGSYTMSKDTRILADKYGEYTQHYICGAHEEEGLVVLHIAETNQDFFSFKTMSDTNMEVELKELEAQKLAIEARIKELHEKHNA